jgi:MFS family permease
MSLKQIDLKREQKGKIGIGNWIIIWVAGLAGQLAWNIENQWFNSFVYAHIAPDPTIITWMVAVSAIVTTLSTFISGTGSDRLGRRKPFIVAGYILWGVFTICFGLTSFADGTVNNIVALGSMVVVADALMSFFGSLGNDAGFNPWTTDISNEKNRGALGAVIAVQPVIATIVGSLLGGLIIEHLGYLYFFIIMGAFVVVIGVYCLFALKDSKTLKPNVDPKGYWHQFGQAFNFKLLAKNKLLLIVLCIFAMFFISFNIYFPHMTTYLIYSRGYEEGLAGILLGAGLVVAVPFTILAGKFINKGKFVPTLIIAVAANMVGLAIMSLSSLFPNGSTGATVIIALGIFFVGGGYMVVYQALMIWCKNLYPEEQRGQLEGVRLFFYVCIPMVFGPLIANPIIQNFGKPISIEYTKGVVDGFAPSEIVFYVALAAAALTFVPIFFAWLYQKKHPVAVMAQELAAVGEIDAVAATEQVADASAESDK